MANEPTGTPDPATGTTAPAADGAASGPAGGAGAETPEQLKARINELESQRKQDLARLSSGEEAARRARDLELENERLRNSQPPPTGYDPNAQLAQAWQMVAENNPELAQVVASAFQTTEQRVARVEAENRWYRELGEVSDPKERAEVEARARELKVSPSWARRDLNSQKTDAALKEAAELRQRIADDEARRQRGVVTTHAGPAPPPPSNANEMKSSDYAAKQRELQRDGNMQEAIALKARKDSGDLKVVPG